MDTSGGFGECSQILVLGANTVCLETYSWGALRTSLWCHWSSYWLKSLEENRKTCGQMGEPTGELKSQAGFPLLFLFLIPQSLPPFFLFLPTPPTLPSPLSFHFFPLPLFYSPTPCFRHLEVLGDRVGLVEVGSGVCFGTWVGPFGWQSHQPVCHVGEGISSRKTGCND